MSTFKIIFFYTLRLQELKRISECERPCFHLFEAWFSQSQIIHAAFKQPPQEK